MPQETQNKIGISPKRIIIVDDMVAITIMLRAFLEDEGYSVATHEDPTEALHDILTNGADLVVADYNMPGMNGIELLQNAQKSSRPIHAFIITANPWDIKEKNEYPVLEKGTNLHEKVVAAVASFFNASPNTELPVAQEF